MATGKPSEDRVDELYKQLYGPVADRRAMRGEKRHNAQQLAYVEDACRSILEGIDKLKDYEKKNEALREIRADIRFLLEITDDKEFIGSLDV